MTSNTKGRAVLCYNRCLAVTVQFGVEAAPVSTSAADESIDQAVGAEGRPGTGGAREDSADELGTQAAPVPSQDGLEREDLDPDEITNPFDPEKIRVRTVSIVVDQIVSRITHNEIDLAPDFQRASEIWNDRQQSRLIESLMLRIPIPVFYVASDEEEKWSVVDGVQRISTLDRFVKGKFGLKKLEYLTGMENKFFTDLPRYLQRRIKETQIVIHVIEPSTPEEVMFNIFRRINTGGLPLRAQEIRHAMYRGPVREYLKELATLDAFLNATTRSIKVNRMADRECVLRFLAFYIEPWQSYSSNNIDGLFNDTMARINGLNLAQRDRIKGIFENSMRAAYQIFGDHSFRKRYDLKSTKRFPINGALFEAWSVVLAKCTQSEISSLVHRREEVQGGFVELMKNNREFDNSVSYGTGAPARVKTRFQSINDLVQRSLEC